jgi:Ca2+-binding EF-hand superfamily protein
LEGKDSNEKYVLSVLQRAFDKGQQGQMDADSMIHWLKQELQLGYTSNQSEKAL